MYIRNDALPCGDMMHLLRKYDVAPVGRNDAMFAIKCGEAVIIGRSQHHLSKANIIQKTHLCRYTKVRFLLVDPTGIAFGNIFRLPYESELSTAYAQMCTRFGTECRASSTPMSGQKEKETRRVSLFLFGGPDGS